jgi:signal transduction histidine kinase/sugar lactone lactonase YvrE
VWAGTNGGGLCRLSGERFSCLTSRDGLPGDLVWALGEDREGGLWAGTSGGGIGRLREGRFLTYGRREGLSADVVLPVLGDGAGGIWVGTAGGGLNHFDTTTGQVKAFGVKDGIPHGVVLSLERDPSSGDLWIGTAGGGLTRYDGNRFVTLTTRDGLGSNLVQTIVITPDGSVWAGTNGGGISIVTGSQITTLRMRDGLPSDRVVSLLVSRDQTVWAGTTNGLARISGRRVVPVEAPGTTGRTVLALYESSDGAIWAGTMGSGLFRISNGRAASIRKKDGLFDDLVGAIVEDGAGNLWMTCNKGVFRTSQSDLEAFMEGRARSVTSVSYGTRDGLRTTECNGGYTPSSWRASDGRLWFPTGKGLSVIDPTRLYDDGIAPPVRIETVLVDGRAADLERPIVVAAGSKNLEFRFTALSFVSPRSLRFRYRLEGFDDAWIDAGNRRTAYYTNVPPGTYRFQTSARNADGAWNQEGSALAVGVEARFVQSPAFALLCLASAGAALFAITRLRIRKMRRSEVEHARAQALLETLVADRTAQLKAANDALEAFSASVSHDLRAPLRALDGFSQILIEEHSERLGPEGKRLLGRVREATSRMTRLVNDILRFSRVGRQQLLRERVDMTGLTRGAFDELAAVDEGPAIDFSLDPLPEAVADAALVRQVWLNLLSNALKFSALRARRTVYVRGRKEDGQCLYEVEDNGVGFDMAGVSRIFGVFERLHGAGEFEGTGVGLSLVKQIIERHGGTVSARGEVGVGATISFTLPDAPLPSPESDPDSGPATKTST